MGVHAIWMSMEWAKVWEQYKKTSAIVKLKFFCGEEFTKLSWLHKMWIVEHQSLAQVGMLSSYTGCFPFEGGQAVAHFATIVQCVQGAWSSPHSYSIFYMRTVIRD